MREFPEMNGLYCTTMVTVVECVKAPLVPVIVSTRLPVRVVLLVVTVRVLVPEPVIEAGLKLAVEFLGRLVTLRLTVPVKPFSAPTVTV